MRISGKIICGLLGFSISGPIGLILGIWLGHIFDKALDQNFGSVFQGADPLQTQQLFFESTFAVMGHLAKADGVVKQTEIEAAEQVMLKLGLSGEKRQQAIDAFNFGKSSEFDLLKQIQALYVLCVRKPSLVQMFLEIQIFAATADGAVSNAERVILYQVGDAFRIPALQIDRLIEMVIAQQSFRQKGSSGQYTTARGPSLESAYQVFGLDASATAAEIKRTYRKLMSQHHPDKLIAKGMPQEMVKVATEKSQEIQAAYEMLKKHKEFK